MKILAWFTSVYCRDHHTRPHLNSGKLTSELEFLQRFTYCAECQEFVTYAIERRLKCPMDEKPSCKHCHIQCFQPGHREKVREIMCYSGKALIKRGRLDLLWHYLC